LPDSTSVEATVIRIAALKAARDAANHMVKTSAQKNANSVGAFALYTWGSLAFVSAMFAVVIGISPTNLVSKPITLAENKPSLRQTVSKFELPPPSITPKPIEALVEQVAPLEKPNLPEVKLSAATPQESKLPKVKLVETELKLQLDTRHTGSIQTSLEDQLQPFPDAPLPDNLFAVDIGGAKTIFPLVQRYAALNRRAPDLFQTIEPRIQVKGQGQSLQARLVAGPFTSQDEVAHFCRALRLRLTVDCTVSTFVGDPIQ